MRNRNKEEEILKDRKKVKTTENNYIINSTRQLPDQNFGVLEFYAAKVDTYITKFWNN
jgi:hypothetical protein